MAQNRLFPQLKLLTIPNLLSLIRILLIPLFIRLYYFDHERNWAVFVLVLSGLTDLADGFIARHFNMISDFGKALDPLADKLTQASVLISLISEFPSMLIPVIFLFAKELTTAVFGFIVVRKTGEMVAADWHGKVCTALLYAMMILHILWPAIPPSVSLSFIILCVSMMILSFILYNLRTMKAYRAYRETRPATGTEG